MSATQSEGLSPQEAEMIALSDVELGRRFHQAAQEVNRVTDDHAITDRLYWLLTEAFERWAPDAEVALQEAYAAETWPEDGEQRARELAAHRASMFRRASAREARADAEPATWPTEAEITAALKPLAEGFGAVERLVLRVRYATPNGGRVWPLPTPTLADLGALWTLCSYLALDVAQLRHEGKTLEELLGEVDDLRITLPTVD